MEKRFSVSNALQTGFKLTIDNAFLLIFKTNLLIIGLFVGGFILSMPLLFLTMKLPIMPFIIFLAWLFFYLAIELGYIKMTLNIYDFGIGTTNMLFSCFNIVFIYLIASLLYWVAVGIGFVLLIIPGIYFMLRLQFFPYFLIDKQAGIFDSLSKSWDLTQSATGDLFILFIVLLAAKALGALIIFGSLLAIPFAHIAMASAYRQLLASSKPVEITT